MTSVAIALGSNLGDRRGHLDWAVRQLAACLDHLRVSSFIETDPVGVPDAQPPYLNAAAVGACALEPEALMAQLARLEHGRGRRHDGFRSSRTLDLDLIFYGDRAIDTPELTVPHPRFREREFVLAPLAEIGADLVDPVTGKTVGELLEDLRAS